MNAELLLNFGKIIRELRKGKKISQEELGFQSNLHRTYIGMIERGEKNITLENIEKLSKGLDVSMKLIFEKLNKIYLKWIKIILKNS
jgi:transcriptional regulator with XRE-family HTH domain